MNSKAEKIVNEMLDEKWEEWMTLMLRDVRNRWIEERTMGRGRPGGGFEEPQMTPEQARAAWRQELPRFRHWILTDPKARELKGHYQGRIDYRRQGQAIKQAQLAAGEKPWDSYMQPQ